MSREQVQPAARMGTSLLAAPSARRRGISFAEVLITVAIVAMVGIGIILSLAMGAYMQQSIRERNGAMRIATELLESSRRELFERLATSTRTVVIDDRGTADQGDDVRGQARVRFFLVGAGSEVEKEVGTSTKPVPLDGSALRAVVTVAWTPAGRFGGGSREVRLSSLVSPP